MFSLPDTVHFGSCFASWITIFNGKETFQRWYHQNISVYAKGCQQHTKYLNLESISNSPNDANKNCSISNLFSTLVEINRTQSYKKFQSWETFWRINQRCYKKIDFCFIVNWTRCLVNCLHGHSKDKLSTCSFIKFIPFSSCLR